MSRTIGLRTAAVVTGKPVVAVEVPSHLTSTPTIVVTSVDGTKRVVQRVSHTSAVSIHLAAGLLENLHIPTAPLVASAPRSGSTLLAFDFIFGHNGSRLLDGPDGPRMAREMGSVAAILRTHGPRSGIRLDPMWRDEAALLRRIVAWRSGDDVAPGPPWPSDSGSWTLSVSHGDFAPINALFDGGRLVGLLDLGDFRVRHSLVDIAWWCLVVHTFHRVAFDRLASTFLQAALPNTEDRTNAATLITPVAAARTWQLTRRRQISRELAERFAAKLRTLPEALETAFSSIQR